MIFMLTVWYPPEKVMEVTNLYNEQPREIPYIKKWEVFNASGGTKGYKQYHLVKSERGKGEEAMSEILKYISPLQTKIEGFRTHLEVVMGLQDSLKLMPGMDWK
ncbi:MAG: hypothetical protein ACW967_07060 [Candidatus Hodarchaeales archaeon]|jgi:hypothetical protein